MSEIQNYKHYVITRFNLFDRAGYDVSSYEYINSDKYLDLRFQLFDTYCFPSVSKQTNTNFTWLILFNDKLPERWRIKMQKYIDIFPNLEIRYLSEIFENKWKNLLSNLIKKELEICKINPEFIITTRIDNDDAFNLSYIDEIQNYYLKNQQESIINFSNGLQFVPEYRVLKNHRNKYGHFGSLIEKNDGKAETILAFPHNAPPIALKSICLDIEQPMWLEVLHQTNVMNIADFQINNLIADLLFIGLKYKNLSNFGIKQSVPRYNFYIWKLFFEWFCKKIKSLIKKF